MNLFYISVVKYLVDQQ